MYPCIHAINQSNNCILREYSLEKQELVDCVYQSFNHLINPYLTIRPSVGPRASIATTHGARLLLSPLEYIHPHTRQKKNMFCMDGAAASLREREKGEGEEEEIT